MFPQVPRRQLSRAFRGPGDHPCSWYAHRLPLQSPQPCCQVLPWKDCFIKRALLSVSPEPSPWRPIFMGENRVAGFSQVPLAFCPSSGASAQLDGAGAQPAARVRGQCACSMLQTPSLRPALVTGPWHGGIRHTLLSPSQSLLTGCQGHSWGCERPASAVSLQVLLLKCKHRPVHAHLLPSQREAPSSHLQTPLGGQTRSLMHMTRPRHPECPPRVPSSQTAGEGSPSLGRMRPALRGTQCNGLTD